MKRPCGYRGRQARYRNRDPHRPRQKHRSRRCVPGTVDALCMIGSYSAPGHRLHRHRPGLPTGGGHDEGPSSGAAQNLEPLPMSPPTPSSGPRTSTRSTARSAPSTESGGLTAPIVRINEDGNVRPRRYRPHQGRVLLGVPVSLWPAVSREPRRPHRRIRGDLDSPSASSPSRRLRAKHTSSSSSSSAPCSS